MTTEPGGPQSAGPEESASAHLRAAMDSAACRRTAAERSLTQGRARRRVLPAVVVTSVLAVTAGVSDTYVRAQVAPATAPAAGPGSGPGPGSAGRSPSGADAWARLEQQLKADKESMLRLERQGRAAERLSGRLLHQATALSGTAASVAPTGRHAPVTAPPTSSPPPMVTAPPTTAPPTMVTAPPTTTSLSPMVTAPPTTHATTGPSSAG